MALNPFRHIHSKVMRLLESEAKLSEDERRSNQWQLLIKFNDTQITVGKGDVNTIFYQFGLKGKRLVCYPDQILDLLKRRGAQQYWRYCVKDSGGSVVRFYWDESKALLHECLPSHSIYGVSTDEKLLYKSVKTLDGREWKSYAKKKQ